MDITGIMGIDEDGTIFVDVADGGPPSQQELRVETDGEVCAVDPISGCYSRHVNVPAERAERARALAESGRWSVLAER